ncbi:hypothetical protein IQ06DRAFT_377231 [Phaeosphaeriaceae sp. SRC1lsM3a]|nr:hypothetical protein IQ06DRAFT_377231 [Stagonospora sp. SRC1lsM3a]
MLIHPDRQRFEQIRARWEAAQQSEDEVANMVGRRISQQPTSREAPRDGSNKFRRTISQGLAFISNPLSQRKTTPGRQTAHRTSVAVTAATINTCAPSSPRHTERSTTETGPPNKADSNTTNLQPDATPKTVPRSRTLSFLPRPVDPTLRAMPSKIPAPSPPPQGRRVSSPRQYILHHAPLQERHVVVKQECRERCATSPSKVVVRSRTTPSLHKAADPPQLAHSKNPKPAGYKALGAMPVAPKHTLQENISANKRSSQQLPQILEKTPRHESLATPTPLRSNTEKDLHRKILGTPNGLGGMWRSSRALAAANHEIRDYMPPLYWAGRFQARYDQWRTEAMASTLNLDSEFCSEDQLSQCGLEEEKLAVCYIFAQLQSLCLTEQAADSLWEFEVRYRQDHKLPAAHFFHPPRKHNDQTTPKGALGRAVRKLTPRKSSLVNLLKGKSLGKADEVMAHGRLEQHRESLSDDARSYHVLNIVPDTRGHRKSEKETEAH